MTPNWLRKLHIEYTKQADILGLVETPTPMPEQFVSEYRFSLPVVKQSDENLSNKDGPPNLRQVGPMEPSCNRCEYFDVATNVCNLYHVQVPSNAVCDSFEQVTRDETPNLMKKLPKQPDFSDIKLAQANQQIIPPMPTIDGSKPQQQSNQLQSNKLQSNQLQSSGQLPTQIWKPSVVAEMAQAEDSNNTWLAQLMSMFSQPQQQSQQRSQQQIKSSTVFAPYTTHLNKLTFSDYIEKIAAHEDLLEVLKPYLVDKDNIKIYPIQDEAALQKALNENAALIQSLRTAFNISPKEIAEIAGRLHEAYKDDYFRDYSTPRSWSYENNGVTTEAKLPRYFDNLLDVASKELSRFSGYKDPGERRFIDLFKGKTLSPEEALNKLKSLEQIFKNNPNPSSEDLLNIFKNNSLDTLNIISNRNLGIGMWPAIGLAGLAGLGAAGLGYGGYKLYNYLKAPKKKTTSVDKDNNYSVEDLYDYYKIGNDNMYKYSNDWTLAQLGSGVGGLSGGIGGLAITPNFQESIQNLIDDIRAGQLSNVSHEFLTRAGLNSLIGGTIGGLGGGVIGGIGDLIKPKKFKTPEYDAEELERDLKKVSSNCKKKIRKVNNKINKTNKKIIKKSSSVYRNALPTKTNFIKFGSLIDRRLIKKALLSAVSRDLQGMFNSYNFLPSNQMKSISSNLMLPEYEPNKMDFIENDNPSQSLPTTNRNENKTIEPRFNYTNQILESYKNPGLSTPNLQKKQAPVPTPAPTSVAPHPGFVHSPSRRKALQPWGNRPVVLPPKDKTSVTIGRNWKSKPNRLGMPKLGNYIHPIMKFIMGVADGRINSVSRRYW